MRSGYIAIVGRPNVGKSTLLNRILGQKISITSHKPQTTRHRVLGIKTNKNVQCIYVDTPGIHLGAKKAMNRYMNRAAVGSFSDVDLVLFVVEAFRWTEEDQLVLERLKKFQLPVILVINKVDNVSNKEDLLPFISKISEIRDFENVFPISAKKGLNVSSLEEKISSILPEGINFYPKDQVTDRSERFIAAELIREQAMRLLRQELPYTLTVEIEKFERMPNVLNISGVIWVERDSQKGMVIGKKGLQLKAIGEKSRKEMQKCFDGKVFLQLWVKVKEGWTDDERVLQSFGYKDGF